MQVAQLLPELMLIAQVAVIIALLPENATTHPFAERQLQVVNGIGQQPVFGFTHQQMHMLRHHHESVDAHCATATRVF